MDNKLDVAAAYPEGGCVYNISRRTTVREISSIDGFEEDIFRIQNMSLTAGHVNAIEYCTTMLKAPRPTDMLSMFREDIKNGVIPNNAPQVVYIE